MTEREKGRFPAWAERERAGDLAWIRENMHVFWPAGQQGYQEHGLGAIVVDTTSRPTGEGHPFGYLPQAVVEQQGDEDAQRMVREYNPAREIVTVLLKPHDRVSIYRVGGGDIIPLMTKELEEDIIRVRPDAIWTEEECQLLQRARAGEIPCPWCERPLKGSFYFFLEEGIQYKGVRLQCSGCGFDER